jgi:NADPH2:quinone reductase
MEFFEASRTSYYPLKEEGKSTGFTDFRRFFYKMKCAVIKTFGKAISNLVVQERKDLVADGENVRVRVAATALNRADLLQRRGLYPAPPGAPQDIPGLEFAGVIDRLGERVTTWKGGERVFGIIAGGGYADQVVVHERQAVRVPATLTDIEAAAVPEVFMVAHDALITHGRMKSGDLVLIHSVAGGLGTAAMQLVDLFGGRAAGTAGSREKLDAVAKLASCFPINYKEEDFQIRIEETFGKNAVDLILDTVGAAYLKPNLALLKYRGRLVLLGLLGGDKGEVSLSDVLFKRIRVVGCTMRARPLEEKIAVAQAFAHEVVPHLESGRLKPVIDSFYPFEQLHEATERMEKSLNIGKIILTF